MFSRKITVLLFVLFLAPDVFAAPLKNQLHPDADNALTNELLWLQSESMVFTTIATKTEMNMAIAPGIISILKGETVEEMGIRTVGEALEWIPGMYYSISSNGTDNLSIRGNSSGYRTKLMLNGVPMNASLKTEITHIPIEQVDQIEVIRGPGSALYGKYAFAGMVNVITKKEGNRIFGQYGRFDRIQGGCIATYSDSKHIAINLNIAGWQRQPSHIDSGPDRYTALGGSNAPGPVNDSRKAPAAFLTANIYDFTFSLQWVANRFADHWGLTGALPKMNDHLSQKQDNRLLELQWAPMFSEKYHIVVKSGWRKYEGAVESMYLFPPGVITPTASIGGNHYEERSLYSNIEWHWDAWAYHQILFGLEIERIEPDDIWMDINYDPLSFEPLDSVQTFKGSKNWLEEGHVRNIRSYFMQDQYKMFEPLTLTFGVRYDDYNDIQSRLTPRISGVYALAKHHILKAQFAEAFRPPTYIDMYTQNNPVVNGNPDLKSELIRTTEIGYFYRHPCLTLGLTLFYSDLSDMIRSQSGTMMNIESADIKGIETELLWEPAQKLKIIANHTHLAAFNRESREPMRTSANYMGNVGVIYSPKDKYSLTLNCRYLGTTFRAPGDPRPDLKGWERLDLSFGVRDIGTNGLDFRLGLKNLLDKDIRLMMTDGGLIEDAKMPGREVWLQFSYRFDSPPHA